MKPGIDGYNEWRKRLHADETLREITANARQKRAGGVDIRYVAILIADHGRNDRGCFAESKTIAALVGCHRNTVDAYRQDLIRLGWFKVVSRTGGDFKRSLVLDIQLPDPWEVAQPDLEVAQPDTEVAQSTVVDYQRVLTSEYLPAKDVRNEHVVDPWSAHTAENIESQHSLTKSEVALTAIPADEKFVAAESNDSPENSSADGSEPAKQASASDASEEPPTCSRCGEVNYAKHACNYQCQHCRRIDCPGRYNIAKCKRVLEATRDPEYIGW